MNRFTASRRSSHPLARRIFTSAAVFFFAAAALHLGADSVLSASSNSQMESLKQAILRSAVTCYALEGMYPESLDYLRSHYGISWNEDRYAVDYEIIASNLMPSVTVIPLR